MSFDKYVQHISQKYRLAVAISVIKTKPENVPVEEYLIQLQNKIRDKEIDPNETVCSDDFNFDDDIWNEKQYDTQMDCTKNDTLNENRLECSVNANSQGSQTILNDFVFGEKCPQRESSLGDTIRLLQEVSANVLEQPYDKQNCSQMTFCESQENNTHCSNTPNEITGNNKHPKVVFDNNLDSQETQLYTLHGFTQDYSHVSQTQNEYFVISDKYIRNNSSNVQVIENAQNRDMIQFSVSQNVITINAEEIKSIETPIIEETVNVENNEVNSQSNQFYYHGDNEINKTGAISKNIIANVTKNVVKEIQTEKHSKTYQTNTDNSKAPSRLNNTNEVGVIESIKDIKETYVTNTKAKDISENNTQFSFNSQNTVNNDDKMKNVEDTQCNSEINKEITQNHNTENIDQENIEVMEVDTESDENIEERVPFKVIEELNRVKTFLNRKDKKYDGYSTDSGYRSDSQHRGSLRSSSQLSDSWLNQSAHCLFSHIMLALPTDDIVKEIAQVLGKLIDKLNEDENYPPFLEELLETVDSMIRDIHTGDGWADHLLLTKDEKIQRVLLLNKSKHILKFSIEKITAILELVYTNLMQENLYECTNIVDLENICYIFNILEIFIKRYKKVKDMSTQSQNSQDILPKRSSLTELWRKKWNPNCKEIIRVENKVSVLKSCSDNLNKIIVECMSGYSLVAFAALQCFNLIQD